MSSLLHCTDELLQQKAVQSSHYERLEQQLLDRERRRRAVALNLKQRITDVERRGNDVAELRRESAQLSTRLTQHTLQLTALQCRQSDAAKRQAAAVERVQDGVRSWTGHPARVVLIVQALREQKRLRLTAHELQRVLRGMAATLRVVRQVHVFHIRSSRVLGWHSARTAQLRHQLTEAACTARQESEAALRVMAEAARDRDGPLRAQLLALQQTQLSVVARRALLAIYEAEVSARCERARDAVVALTEQMDTTAAELAASEAAARDATRHAAVQAEALQKQRQTHAAEQAELEQTLEATAADQTETTAARHRAAQTLVTQREESAEARRQTSRLSHRALVVATVALDLRSQLQRHLQQQTAAQRAEQAAAAAEVAELRQRHAQRLRERQLAREAAAHQHDVAALQQQESQARKATVDLERDEWALLYAQMVREACRARATAAAAAAAAVAVKDAARRKRPAAVAANADEDEVASLAEKATPTARGVAAAAAGKRLRVEGRQPRTTPASRRQRAALEAVDALTLTASQTSGTRLGNGGAAVKSMVPSPVASSYARAAYKLVSVKPSTVKKPMSMEDAETRKGDDAAAQRGLPQANATPYLATLATESDSSFSLMNDSACTDAAAAAVTLPAKVAAGKVRPRSVTRSLSALRVSSASHSPSPRRPPTSRLRHADVAPAAPAHALPRHGRPTLAIRLPDAGNDEDSAAFFRGSAADAQATPRSALDSALHATRTPRPAALAGTAPAVYKVSAATGNAAALPSGGKRGRVTLFPPPPSTQAPAQRASAAAAKPRRRVPPLMPTAGGGGGADDLFADLFS